MAAALPPAVRWGDFEDEDDENDDYENEQQDSNKSHKNTHQNNEKETDNKGGGDSSENSSPLWLGGDNKGAVVDWADECEDEDDYERPTLHLTPGSNFATSSASASPSLRPPVQLLRRGSVDSGSHHHHNNQNQQQKGKQNKKAMAGLLSPQVGRGNARPHNQKNMRGSAGNAAQQHKASLTPKPGNRAAKNNSNNSNQGNQQLHKSAPFRSPGSLKRVLMSPQMHPTHSPLLGHGVTGLHYPQIPRSGGHHPQRIDLPSQGCSVALIKALNGAEEVDGSATQARALPLILAGNDLLLMDPYADSHPVAFAVALIQRLLATTPRARSSPAPTNAQGQRPISSRALIVAASEESVDSLHALLLPLCRDTGLTCDKNLAQAHARANPKDKSKPIDKLDIFVASAQQFSLLAGAKIKPYDFTQLETLILEECDKIAFFFTKKLFGPAMQVVPKDCQYLVYIRKEEVATDLRNFLECVWGAEEKERRAHTVVHSSGIAKIHGQSREQLVVAHAPPPSQHQEKDKEKEAPKLIVQLDDDDDDDDISGEDFSDAEDGDKKPNGKEKEKAKEKEKEKELDYIALGEEKKVVFEMPTVQAKAVKVFAILRTLHKDDSVLICTRLKPNARQLVSALKEEGFNAATCFAAEDIAGESAASDNVREDSPVVIVSADISGGTMSEEKQAKLAPASHALVINYDLPDPDAFVTRQEAAKRMITLSIPEDESTLERLDTKVQGGLTRKVSTEKTLRNSANAMRGGVPNSPQFAHMLSPRSAAKPSPLGSIPQSPQLGQAAFKISHQQSPKQQHHPQQQQQQQQQKRKNKGGKGNGARTGANAQQQPQKQEKKTKQGQGNKKAGSTRGPNNNSNNSNNHSNNTNNNNLRNSNNSNNNRGNQSGNASPSNSGGGDSWRSGGGGGRSPQVAPRSNAPSNNGPGPSGLSREWARRGSVS